MNGNLDACHCCEGLTAETPAAVANRPGLSAIAYRVGTHSQFKDSMLAALSSTTRLALQNLNTRDDDDFTIALLDSFAVVADVLTFYSERIANESFLRTATELSSIVEQARSIGYELNPGVAASTWLAFTLDESEVAPGYATIDAGTKVQSIPGPDETPQTFETIETIEANKEWNSMAVKSTETFPPDSGLSGISQIYLKGTTTNLNQGDVLLIIGNERLEDTSSTLWNLSRVKALATFPDTDADKAYTVVTIDASLVDAPQKNPKVYAFRQRAALFGANAMDWNLLPTEMQEQYKGEPEDETLFTAPAATLRSTPGDIPTEFTPPTSGDTKETWPYFTISDVAKSDDAICLDAVYSGIVADSWIVLSYLDKHSVYLIQTVTEDSPATFGLTTKSTKLTLDPTSLDDFDSRIRETVVFAESEELEWAEKPLTATLEGQTEIVLDGVLEEALAAERTLIVQSESSELEGEYLIEVVTLKETDDDHTTLVLVDALTKAHNPATTVVLGNVAKATHGESKSEILGNGDGIEAHQSFVLSQTPLTYMPAATASGSETTLEIWVNDVKWTEVSSLYNHAPTERIYVVRLADDGTVTVRFGDGISGARLPTGPENVRAVYRKGIGVDGNLEADQLSLLITRPLGVKAVTNPLPTEGGADPQQLEDARTNAPLTVLTLDRAVSLQDYENFSRAFAGIAKALATWTWDGRTKAVFITVAGTDGAEIKEDSDTYSNLLAALQQGGDPFVSLRVQSYRPVYFRFAGKVKVNPDYEENSVLAAVESALREQFSFDVRAFGQPVFLSEVITAVQAVPGVVAVDVNNLYRAYSASTLETRLLAALPGTLADGSVVAAELLTLHSEPLELGVMS